jgi:hypothetical protein
MSDISRSETKDIAIKTRLRFSLNAIKPLSRISQNNMKKQECIFMNNKIDYFRNIRLAIYTDILSKNPKPTIGVHIEHSGNRGYELHANRDGAETLAYISNNRTYRYGPGDHQYAMCLFDMDDLSRYNERIKYEH